MNRASSSPRLAPAKPRKPVIGWREWVGLPDLGIKRIKVKVDTGARSSSLHAYELECFVRGGADFVRFTVHPSQRSVKRTIHCEAPLLEWRWIRSSNGKRERRPVIRTAIRFDAQSWLIDVTLTSRDVMGFRMLLGREAVRRRFLVNPGRSFLIRELVPRPAPLASSATLRGK